MGVTRIKGCAGDAPLEGEGVKAVPDQSKSTHAYRLQICVSASPPCQPRDNFYMRDRINPYRLVISKVVPKIWARTNSAILSEREWGGLARAQ